MVLRSVALLLTVAASLAAQANINAVPVWDGSNNISSFGVPDTATYGQTITIATGTGALLNYAFEIGHCNATVTFRGEIFAWDLTNQRATGASLFESPAKTVTASGTYQLVVIDTSSLALAPGNYVLFVSTSKDQAGSVGCQFGSVVNATYPGGQFVYINNGTTVASWTGLQWSTITQDLAFQANFVGGNLPTTAAPSTLVLTFTALLAAILWGYSKSRSRAAVSI